MIVLAAAGACAGGGRSALDVITTRRSIRRFTSEKIPRETLIEIAEAGSLAPSAGNRQPWEFIIAKSPELIEKITQRLGWLGGPPEKERRPTAYIALLLEKSAASSWAHTASAGAALQNIQLAAWSRGIGSCCFGSIEREEVSRMLNVPDNLHLFVIIGLGFPAEAPVLREVDDSLRPCRDKEGKLHVPRKNPYEIVHLEGYGNRIVPAGKEGAPSPP